MNPGTLTFNQRVVLNAKRLKDKLGLPVSYADFEFSFFKQKMNAAYVPEERERQLSRIFGSEPGEIKSYVVEAEAIDFDEWIRQPESGCDEIGNPMGKTDRITLYTAIRICKPMVVLETGTAAGASATYILSAMEKNGCGFLYSIDAASDRTHIGCLVPDGVRSRLNICYGSSLLLIPEIAEKANGIDFFVHDSLHTYEHMTAEYELFYRHRGIAGGIICSHDILMSNAWDHFIRRHRLKCAGVVKNFGICRADFEHI
jgi:predicted O-methyltransferase YrrM